MLQELCEKINHAECEKFHDCYVSLVTQKLLGKAQRVFATGIS